MNREATKKHAIARTALTAALCLVVTAGCQISLSGKPLPSVGCHFDEDSPYFPASSEFKLPREAAALRAARAEEKMNRDQ
ncbi:MAG: hypothetical protein AAGG48_27065 [Planctomycetota bacterium]